MSWLELIAGMVFGWWLGPAFTQIIKNIKQEIEEWRYR
jgi:hypothetical protein